MTTNEPNRAVMEGGGAYNRHALQQAAGGAVALPLLQRAARDVTLDTLHKTVVIADYGSSQGRNSLLPIRTAIAVLQGRVGVETPISVVHTDLPENDFSTLFQLLETDPDSYLRDQPNVFASAVGRSFYKPLFPPNSVTLGWSAYAVLWPSRTPAFIPGHFYSTRSSGAVLSAFNKQGEDDWRTFLSHRAKELRAGGRLVILVPARDGEGLHRIEPLMDHANATLHEMVNEGLITADERERIVLPAHPKSKADLLAPFAGSDRFLGLVAEYCEVIAGPDPVWEAYKAHCDPERLAGQHAGFFRATFGPTLASALETSGTSEKTIAFNDRLERGLRKRIADDPVEMRAVLATMVIAKR
jgi:S-adenosylmethionine-dependent carboxyl methyltransferase